MLLCWIKDSMFIFGQKPLCVHVKTVLLQERNVNMTFYEVIAESCDLHFLLTL